MLFTALNRWKAAAIYLGLSAAVAVVIVGLMLMVWYPVPYFEAMGGGLLILLLVGVDVVLGPLVVLIIFNPAKRHLKFDLVVIALLQFSALAYGCYVMFESRPVYNVFAIDRFEAVAAYKIDPEALEQATLPEFRTLSYTGPKIIAARRPTDPDEQFRLATQAAAGGADLAALPRYYLPYEQMAADAAARAKPLDVLAKQQPDEASVIRDFVVRSGRPENELGFLPMTGRNKDLAVVVSRKTGEVIGILPIYPW